MILPDGIGKLVKAGSVLMLQMHYTPNGKATTDRTSIGLRFSRKPVQQAIIGGAALNRWFEIPAGNDNYEVKSVYAFKADAHILNLMPHMHLRGKDFEYRLVFADGTAKTILRACRRLRARYFVPGNSQHRWQRLRPFRHERPRG